MSASFLSLIRILLHLTKSVLGLRMQPKPHMDVHVKCLLLLPDFNQKF